MTGYCVFCGAETEEAQATCPTCAALIGGLNPEQRKIIEKLQQDEEARLAFLAAWGEIVESLQKLLEPLAKGLNKLCNVLKPIIEEDAEQ